MNIRTGQTYYYNYLSVDGSGNPLPNADFSVRVIKDGVWFTGLTVTVGLVEEDYGIFSASWSASTVGDYQLFVKNLNTNNITSSDVISVLPDYEFTRVFYIGV